MKLIYFHIIPKKKKLCIGSNFAVVFLNLRNTNRNVGTL